MRSGPRRSPAVALALLLAAPGCESGALNVPGADGGPTGGAAAGSPGGAGGGDVAGPVVTGRPAMLALQPTALEFGEVLVGGMAEAQIAVSNLGGQSVPAPSLFVTGPFQSPQNSCERGLAPGATCFVSVVFSPQMDGPAAGTLTVTAGGHSATATLRGLGVSGDCVLSFAPAQVAFGRVTVGSSSRPMTVALRNSCGSPAKNLQISITGSTQFALAPGGQRCPTNLAPFAICQIDVVFLPQRTGPDDGVLSATYDGYGNALAALTGAGVTGARLSFDVALMEFGPIPPKGTAHRQARLTNSGDLPAVMVNLSLMDDGLGQFVVSDSCGAVLPARASCDVDVAFTPTAPSGAATLIASAPDAGATKIVLRGSLLDSGPLLQPPAFDFGRIPPGMSSAPATFTLENSLGLTIGPGSASIEGADANVFLIGGDTCSGAPLEPKARCMVMVTCSPNRSGPLTAALRVSFPNGPSSTAALMCAGVFPAEWAFEKDDGSGISLFDFSEPPAAGTPVGSRSAELTVYLRNRGFESTGLLTLKREGANADDFVVVDNGCSGSLEPGARCAIRLAFAPKAGGRREGALTVIVATGGVASLTVRGIGLQPLR